MTDPEAEDARLVEKLCDGDGAAAQELYRRYGAPLLRFGVAMSGQRQLAEDMVHDTFVEFLRDPRHFDASRGSVAAYLYGIARHQMSRAARRRGPVVDSLPQDGLAEGDTGMNGVVAASDSAETEETLDRERLVEHVRKAVLSLPVTHREVVALCDLEELSYAAAASILDCPVGTVRSRLHRARALLATQLDWREELDSALPAALACRGTST